MMLDTGQKVGLNNVRYIVALKAEGRQCPFKTALSILQFQWGIYEIASNIVPV